MEIQKIIQKIKEHWKISVGILVAVMTIAGFLIFSNLFRTTKSNEITAMAVQSSLSNLTKPSTIKQSNLDEKGANSEKIVVDVKGAVKNPAVYTVKADLRINDIIKLAGGFADNADQKSINLAAKISDAQVIYVASIDEKTIGATTTTESGNTAGTTAKVGKININTADLTGLQNLSGVGQKKAQDIIDYRTQNGPFKSVDDLGKVSGFGVKTLEKLKDSITVD